MPNNFPRLTPIMKNILAQDFLGHLKKFIIFFVFFNSAGPFLHSKEFRLSRRLERLMMKKKG
jgi:hypothetical protein